MSRNWSSLIQQCGFSTVIFQQSRPGIPLPKGESYLFIGWKQARIFCMHPIILQRPIVVSSISGVAIAQRVQKTPVLIHLRVRFLPDFGCTYLFTFASCVHVDAAVCTGLQYYINIALNPSE
jgi:hypothetical protein